MNDDYASQLAAHLALARSIAQLAMEFPWGSVPAPSSPEDSAAHLARMWNVGFVRGGARLLSSVVVLVEAGLGYEARLPLRALMELTANQYYMSTDPGRALDFAGQELTTKQRLLRAAEDWELGDPERRGAVADEITGSLKSFIDSEPAAAERLQRGFKPWGVPAKDRFLSAGFEWAYDLPFAVSSDLIHAGAMSVTQYVEQVVDPESSSSTGRQIGGGDVALGTQFLLRLLFKADHILKQGNRALLEAYATEYARAARLDAQKFIADLRRSLGPLA